MAVFREALETETAWFKLVINGDTRDKCFFAMTVEKESASTYLNRETCLALAAKLLNAAVSMDASTDEAIEHVRAQEDRGDREVSGDG